MKPHSLATYRHYGQSAGEKLAALGPFAARHGRITKETLVTETRVLACPKVKVADFPDGFIPQKWFEGLEQNQLIASCCRHPENHEIEAHKSHKEEKAPDIYIFTCTCGRRHTRFLVGIIDDVDRPVWQADAVAA